MQSPIQNVEPSPDLKELAKWEMYPSEITFAAKAQPGNPYRPGNTEGKPGAEYPKMLYRAQRTPGTGKLAVMLPTPNPWEFPGDTRGDQHEHARQAALQFNQSCQKVVNNEDEELKARGQGWRATAPEALALAHADHKELSDEAFHRSIRDRKSMSEKALAEAAAAEQEASGRHIGEIPEKPIRKRRPYKRKAKAEVAAA